MNETIKNISKITGPYFAISAATASIISLCYVLISNKVAVILALVSIIIFLLVLLFKLISLIDGYLKQVYSMGEHYSNFIFKKMTTTDGKHFVYDVYIDIQCKKPIMLEGKYNFKWSGTLPPVIKSNLQKLGTIVRAQNSTDFDYINYYLVNPLLYNQSAVLHINMELNDSDGKASPHLETKVEVPVEVICYRVELTNKTAKYNSAAKIYKRLIKAEITPKNELVNSVQFNKATKSFEYFLIKPEIGYYYRMEWEK